MGNSEGKVARALSLKNKRTRRIYIPGTYLVHIYKYISTLTSATMAVKQQLTMTMAVMMAMLLVLGQGIMAAPLSASSPEAAAVSEVDARGEGLVREFSVLSRPMKLKYGEVHNTVQDPIKLPENIVQEFAERPIAIVDYQVDIVRFDDEGNEVQ